MPRIVIRFAESASRELEETRMQHMEQGVPDVGARRVAEVFRYVEVLADHPDLGRVVPEFNQSTLRELIHSPFRIVYRRDPERVSVVRLWRSERLLKIPAADDGASPSRVG